MKICFLACGIFQGELDKILAEIREERLFDCELVVNYLPANLHVNLEQLKNAILTGLDQIVADKIILLYGSKCHNNFHQFLEDYDLVRFNQSNCIELILGEKMKKIDQTSKTFYLTPGWLNKWKEFFDKGWGVDEVEIRQTFGYYDRILLIDTGIWEISEEKILEFFDYTNVLIEVEEVGLAVFRSNIITAVKQALL